tara:strand:- start:530 stop:2113 length:1584 start_codon:yes stop_codon:yes gene_type:complete
MKSIKKILASIGATFLAITGALAASDPSILLDPDDTGAFSWSDDYNDLSGISDYDQITDSITYVHDSANPQGATLVNEFLTVKLVGNDDLGTTNSGEGSKDSTFWSQSDTINSVSISVKRPIGTTSGDAVAIIKTYPNYDTLCTSSPTYVDDYMGTVWGDQGTRIFYFSPSCSVSKGQKLLLRIDDISGLSWCCGGRLRAKPLYDWDFASIGYQGSGAGSPSEIAPFFYIDQGEITGWYESQTMHTAGNDEITEMNVCLDEFQDRGAYSIEISNNGGASFIPVDDNCMSYTFPSTGSQGKYRVKDIKRISGERPILLGVMVTGKIGVDIEQDTSSVSNTIETTSAITTQSVSSVIEALATVSAPTGYSILPMAGSTFADRFAVTAGASTTLINVTSTTGILEFKIRDDTNTAGRNVSVSLKALIIATKAGLSYRAEVDGIEVCNPCEILANDWVSVPISSFSEHSVRIIPVIGGTIPQVIQNTLMDSPLGSLVPYINLMFSGTERIVIGIALFIGGLGSIIYMARRD